MNLNTDNIHNLCASFLQEIRIDIELTSNQEMANMYDVSSDDIVCLDGGVYLVRLKDNENHQDVIKFSVDEEINVPATYWNPADVDVNNVVTTYSFNEAIAKAIDRVISDRIVNASMNLVPWDDEVYYEVGDAYS